MMFVSSQSILVLESRYDAPNVVIGAHTVVPPAVPRLQARFSVILSLNVNLADRFMKLMLRIYKRVSIKSTVLRFGIQPFYSISVTLGLLLLSIFSDSVFCNFDILLFRPFVTIDLL